MSTGPEAARNSNLWSAASSQAKGEMKGVVSANVHGVRIASIGEGYALTVTYRHVPYSQSASNFSLLTREMAFSIRRELQ
jgi:hypothetical protein